MSSDETIKAQCGEDAFQYLKFQRHTMTLSFIGIKHPLQIEFLHMKWGRGLGVEDKEFARYPRYISNL